MEEKIPCAIFGYRDTLAGQVQWMLKQHTNYELEIYVSVNKLPELNNEYEHKSRPNRKTEFVSNNQIFGKEIFQEKNFIQLLEKKNIKHCFVLEDDRFLRKKIIDELIQNDITVCSFIHPTVYLGSYVSVGLGVIIFPNCYIGYKSDIGDGSIIQSNSRIEHHNVIGNFVDINPNLTTGGFTKIDGFCEINISVDIVNKITIGEYSRVGAGSLVLDNIEANSLCYGRPCKFIRANIIEAPK